MSTDSPFETIVLQEFRLHAADGEGTVARIVASSVAGSERPVPLLTSIADKRDVATIRAVRATDSTTLEQEQRTILGPFVSSWQEPKHYLPRVVERSQRPPGSYRLAVTESGINDATPDLAAEPMDANGTSVPLRLIWIGLPVGSHAGLLVLLGHATGADRVRPAAGDWPLPLSASLGVRIYEGAS